MRVFCLEEGANIGIYCFAVHLLLATMNTGNHRSRKMTIKRPPLVIAPFIWRSVEHHNGEKRPRVGPDILLNDVIHVGK